MARLKKKGRKRPKRPPAQHKAEKEDPKLAASLKTTTALQTGYRDNSLADVSLLPQQGTDKARRSPAHKPEKQSGLDYGEMVHAALDVAGLFPVVGEAADGINALYYLLEGRKAEAAISAAAMIPIVGDAAKGAKWAAKGAKAASKGAKTAKGAKAASKGAKVTDKEAKQFIAKEATSPPPH